MTSEVHAVHRLTVGGVNYLHELALRQAKQAIVESNEIIDGFLEAMAEFERLSGTKAAKEVRVASMAAFLANQYNGADPTQLAVLLASAVDRIRELESFDKAVPRP